MKLCGSSRHAKDLELDRQRAADIRHQPNDARTNFFLEQAKMKGSRNDWKGLINVLDSQMPRILCDHNSSSSSSSTSLMESK
jgi:hypothetical protein